MRTFFVAVLLAGLWCVAAPAALAQDPGAVLVTEMLVNPGGTITDASGEWIELYNTTDTPINLRNWTVRDSAASGVRPMHTIAADVIVPAFGFVVIGNSTNTTANGGVPVTYSYGMTMSFANSLDRFQLFSPSGTLVDQAFYASAAISAQNGISRERLGTFRPWGGSSIDGTLWADAPVTAVYGPGGRGTPGSAGPLTVPAPTLAQAQTTAGAGYRLVAPPLRNVSVRTLAGLNLVQGLPDEFPNAVGPNVFVGFTGDPSQPNSGYVAPTGLYQFLAPGRGVLWYMYAEGGPPPSATEGLSRRADLPLTLSVQGTPRTTSVETTFTAADRVEAPTADFLLLGNPYEVPFDLSGVTASFGLLSSVFQAYDPAAGFQIVTTVPGLGDGDASDDLAVWQGVYAEFASTPTLPVTVSFDAAARVEANPTRSAGSGRTRVGLVLDGVTAADTTHDEAAVLLVAPEAGEGWDALDASKQTPFASPYATLAFVGPGPDGAPRALAQRALPDAAAAGPLALAVTATAAGRYTLALAPGVALPAGWLLRLADLATGAVTALAPGSAYAFDSPAVAGEARFTLTVEAGVVAAGDGPPAGASLTAVAPNPTAGEARATLRVDEAQAVRADVVDVLGRRVLVVFEGTLGAGAEQALRVATDALPGGAYRLVVTGERFGAAQAFTVVR